MRVRHVRHEIVYWTLGLLAAVTPLAAQEAHFSGSHLFVEQDEFAKPWGLGGDQNYTMGVGIQLTGAFVRRSFVGKPQFLLDRLFSGIGLPLTPDTTQHETLHSVMLLGSAFTPDDITQVGPVMGDRPYASLLGLSTRRVSPRGDLDEWAVATELTIAFLGLGVSRDVQTWIHKKLNSDTPMGWDHQISNGGEPTAYYRIGAQRHLTGFRQENAARWLDASADADLWLGYYTSVSLGGTARLGRIRSRYFEFGTSPLGGASQALVRQRSGGEFFAFASGRGRLVGYNALLQGQFKDNPYELGSDEIERLIGEVEAGVHTAFGLTADLGFYLTWSVVAGRSADVATSYGRWHWWGSAQLGLTRTY